MIHAVALALVLTASTQVTLRGGEATPAGEIVAVDAGGVWLGPPAPAPAAPQQNDPAGSTRRSLDAPTAAPVLVIPWDRIKTVSGQFAAQAASFHDAAELAWRARTRLERSDFPAAEPLFEKLFVEQFRSQTGPTAAVVDEGLLRCRIHRAAHAASIEPWLALLRTGNVQTAPVLHANWAAESGLAPIIDPQSGLCPGLPPMWLAWKSVDTVSVPPVSLKPGDKPTQVDARVQALGDLYTQAAKFELGQPATLPELATNDPGVNFVWQIVAARIGNPDQRDAARKLLTDRLAKSAASAASAQLPAWQEAWCHAAIGRSLLREDSGDTKRLGVVELLNLPARYSHAHPYLAGLALAEASATLRTLGDTAGADVLAAELFREYPTHPAIDWAPMRSFIPKAEPATPKASSSQPRPADPPAQAPSPNEPPKPPR